jgi:hypothetical protein
MRGHRLILFLALLGVAFPASTALAGAPGEESPSFFRSNVVLVSPIAADAGLGRRPEALAPYPNNEWFLYHLHWQSWTATEASATGRSWLNTCDPNCLALNWSKRPATVTLSEPGLFDGHLVFKSIRIVAANSPDKSKALRLTRSDGNWWFVPEGD